jgi:RHH-type rel operon transcriptional repressor/antitoxin RelB
MTAVRLDPQIEKRLTKLAASTGRSKSYYLRQALEEHLEDMEDAYIALHRLEKPTTTSSLEDIENALGLSV